MSYKTEATVYPTFVAFVVAEMEESVIFDLGHDAMRDVFVKMSEEQFQDSTPEQYVEYVLENTNFADLAKSTIEMVLLEQGKTAIYAANNRRVVVVNLPE